MELRPVILTLLLLAVTGLVLVVVNRRFIALGAVRVTSNLSSAGPSRELTIDLGERPDSRLLPFYVDLDVGDRLRIEKPDGGELVLEISEIVIESRSLRVPRTRVELRGPDGITAARCGMLDRAQGGIAPIEIDGVRIGVEITRLLFSTIPRGSSPFNAYANFRLRGDVRLAVWDAARPIWLGSEGLFVIDQPEWMRQRFGNWLHRTGYGLHSAIDIYATRPGADEPVWSPVDGHVYKVYNVDAAADDSRRNKVVNLFSDAFVGPQGERVLFRFQHLSEILVRPDEPVRRGQPIGRTGHTGFDPKIGDHLHFEMRLDPSFFGFPSDDSIFATIPINPYNYLLEWYADRQGRGRGSESEGATPVVTAPEETAPEETAP